MQDERAAKIAALNDEFRKNLSGNVFLTPGLRDQFSIEDQLNVLQKVRSFSDFTPSNDPHGERDFGSFVHGEKIFFKVDYYDPELKYGSEDPADPSKTTRVMTIMLASEY